MALVFLSNDTRQGDKRSTGKRQSNVGQWHLLFKLTDSRFEGDTGAGQGQVTKQWCFNRFSLPRGEGQREVLIATRLIDEITSFELCIQSNHIKLLL